MAKTNNSANSHTPATSEAAETKPVEAKTAPAVPAGYEEVGGDLVGYWDPEGGHAIHFIPEGVNLTDGSQDADKVSALITGRLVDACILYKGKEGEREEVQGKAGDRVGVWGKPGLIELKRRAGVKCFVVRTPEHDKKIKNKKDLMKAFSVRCPKGAAKRELPLDDDFRKESANSKTQWLPGAADGSGDEAAPF